MTSIERPALSDLTVDDLVAWKQLEYLRIAARDLTGLDELDATGQALAELAADVFARPVAWPTPKDLAVIGMGKLGGQRAQLLERRRRACSSVTVNATRSSRAPAP